MYVQYSYCTYYSSSHYTLILDVNQSSSTLFLTKHKFLLYSFLSIIFAFPAPGVLRLLVSTVLGTAVLTNSFLSLSPGPNFLRPQQLP